MSHCIQCGKYVKYLSGYGLCSTCERNMCQSLHIEHPPVPLNLDEPDEDEEK